MPKNILIALMVGLFAHHAVAQAPAAGTKANEEIPSDKQLLEQLAGDSESRLAALRHTGTKLWSAPDKFYPAVTACGDDTDVAVRRAVVTQIGQYMVWSPGENKEQDQRAIDFLMERSHDEDYRVTYNCVYYGLSVVQDKSDELIDRLLDIVLIKGQHATLSTFGRLVWGCRPDAQRVASIIQNRINRLKPSDAREARILAMLMNVMTNRFPEKLDRFADTGECVILLNPKPPLVPDDENEFEQEIRSTLGKKAPIDRLLVGVVRGDFTAVALVSGFANYVTLLREIDARGEFSSEFHAVLDDIKEDDRQRIMDNITKAFETEPDHEKVSYADPFRELFERLGRDYVHFESKKIDWDAVGREFLPRSEELRTRAQFCLLCQELIARLEDSHAYLFKGKFEPPSVPVPRWDPGFACLIDDQFRPVVYHVDAGSPAESAGLRAGMVVTHLDGQDVEQVMHDQMQASKKYAGYSSDRYLRYHTAQWLGRRMQRDTPVKLTAIDIDGQSHDLEMKATMGVRYLPRLPVPSEGIADSASVSWKRLDDGIGYIYVRRIRGDLPETLDAAVAQLKECHGLVIDVRGNSGGGFDAERSFRNVDLKDAAEPDRPRFRGPIAVLIDSRCISAGEGWASWFRANDRAKFFGETTAGASSRKKTIDVLDGAYKVIYSVKAYKGFLDRPIERRGLEPDVPVRQTASDLSNGIDTVLAAARRYLKALE